jgi:3-hydroxyacyl-CoA dehydrogenase
MINAIKKAAIIGGGVIGGGWAARFQEPSLPLRTMEPHGLLEHLEHHSCSPVSFPS